MQTENPIWQDRVERLLGVADLFFKEDPSGVPVLTEVICEPQGFCKVDQSSFKAYLARWMTATAKVAPFTAQRIRDKLAPSAQAAAVSCSNPGGDGGVQCGEKWYTGRFDGKTGIGMQMNALEVIQTLIDKPGPLEADRGSSKGNPSAGGDHRDSFAENTNIIAVTTADRAGAAILTVLFGGATLFGGWWAVK